jgi:hypothetical protein
MPTGLEVLYLTDLEIRSFGYRPANKHTTEENFLRDITPRLVVTATDLSKDLIAFTFSVQQ